MNITTVSYLFMLCIVITRYTGKAARENKNIAVLDATELYSATTGFIGSYKMGTAIEVKVLQGDYTLKSKEVFVIILNSQHLFFSFGYDWTLDKWENNQWISPQMNKWMFMLDDEILLFESDFFCFHFPIEYHKITSGRYRISKSLWNDS